MADIRVPKQWSLTKTETIASFEAWRQNLQYTLSLDHTFSSFLVDGFTWLKKSNTTPLRGLVDDGEEVPAASRRTAAQKTTQLDLMLGQIANFCPIISRNTIVNNSKSVANVWQSIRLHYGFQSTGAHFLDLIDIHLEANERPEDLFQRLTSFVEDNLLRADGNIQHHGDIPDSDEEVTPSLENMIVLTWLRLINRDLPSLVKQRYGTELRSQTLSSLKPEISQALDSLLDEIHTASDAKVLRAVFKGKTHDQSTRRKPEPLQRQVKSCVLCKQTGRAYSHFLSTCQFLPHADRQYMSKARQAINGDESNPLSAWRTTSHMSSMNWTVHNAECDAGRSQLDTKTGIGTEPVKKEAGFPASYIITEVTRHAGENVCEDEATEFALTEATSDVTPRKHILPNESDIATKRQKLQAGKDDGTETTFTGGRGTSDGSKVGKAPMSRRSVDSRANDSSKGQ